MSLYGWHQRIGWKTFYGAVRSEKPRTTGRQRNRPNLAANTPEEYFKRSIFIIPFLDGIVNDLMIRFQSHNTVALKMCAFIPSYLQRYTPSMTWKTLLIFTKRATKLLSATCVVSMKDGVWNGKRKKKFQFVQLRLFHFVTNRFFQTSTVFSNSSAVFPRPLLLLSARFPLCDI